VIKAGSNILTQKQNDKNMESHYAASPKEKKFWTLSSAEKIMGTVFGDANVCILIDILPRNETVNTVCYVQMFRKLQCALCDIYLMKTHHSST
jgi:hypothetical protein